MKNHRLSLISEILASSCIRSQEELQGILASNGVTVTQATLSRDLRQLKVIKSHTPDGGYCYKIPIEPSVTQMVESNPHFTVESIKSLEFGPYYAVVKTYPGFAAAVASIIDDNVKNGIMGTIAGDDTVLVILRPPFEKTGLISNLSRYIMGIENKVI